MPIPPAVLVALASAPQTAYGPREDLDAGRYLKALSDAESELRKNPGNALAWAAKSQALSALLRFPEADEAASKALAYLGSRDHVLPDDVLSVLPDVLRHRLLLTYDSEADGVTTDEVIGALVGSVPRP